MSIYSQINRKNISKDYIKRCNTRHNDNFQNNQYVVTFMYAQDKKWIKKCQSKTFDSKTKFECDYKEL